MLEDFLGTAPPSQLLILMAVPLTGALLIVVFLFISFARRNKNSGMKLGIPPKSAKGSEIPSAAPAASEVDLRTALLSSSSPEPPPPDTRPIPPPAKPAETTPAEPTEALNLGPLFSKINRDTPMKDIPQSTGQQKSNLMNRMEHKATEPPQPVELLRLLRDPGSGQLIVEVAGRRYTKLADITDKTIGQYVLKLVAHLLVFTNGVIMTEAGMKSLSTPKAGSVPEPITPATVSKTPLQTKAAPHVEPPPAPAAPPAPAKAPTDLEATFLASLRAAPPQPEPPKKRGFLGIGGIPQPPPLLPEINLAEEINDIVQARLRYSPLADQHHIEITSDLSGGIRIKVDGHYYSSPDDIPDSAIKDLIKASIKEWERR